MTLTRRNPAATGRSLLPLISLLVALLALALLAAGCGGDDEGDTSATSASVTTSLGTSTTELTATTGPASESSTTTAGSAGTATTKTSLLSSSEKDLGNGRVRAGGFIERAWEEAGVRRIEIDYADFLTGEEAEAAGAAAGEEVNNDYYIRNQNRKLRTFEVTAASFELPQGDPSAPDIGGWEDFRAYAAERPFVYFWIERIGNDVVLVEGQWVP